MKSSYNRISVIVILLMICLLSVGLASAFNCSITTRASCTETPVFYMKNDTGGYNNAHVELANQSNYPYTLCCDSNAEGESMSNDCSVEGSKTIMKISGITDAHAQIPSINDYSQDVCMNVDKYNLVCNYRNGACLAGEECLFSMASSEVNGGNYNQTNAHVGNCSYYSLNTCCNLTFTNELPNAVDINITPIYPNTTSDLICNFKIVDFDDAINLKANYSWYKNGILQSGLSGQKFVSNNTMDFVTLDSSEFEHFENWSCQITGYDGYQYGLANMSSNVTILNLPPSIPILSNPINGKGNLFERNVSFEWKASSDSDNDAITYHINVTNIFDSRFEHTLSNPWNTSNTYYIFNEELHTLDEVNNQEYFWQVKACDEYDACSNWSQLWNFSILSSLVVDITSNAMNFDNVKINTVYDTDAVEYDPFTFENNGNVRANLVNITADKSLWLTQGFDKEYMQIKADTSIYPNSFNLSGSLMSWMNLTNGIYNDVIIDKLNYRNNNNSIETDVRIKVPGTEPPGSKSMELTFIWEGVPNE